MNRNCRRSAYRLNGSNGMRCISQKLTSVTMPNASERIATARSSGARSRRFVQTASATPDAPKPRSAVEITRKPKWYQSATDNKRVSASSSRSVASARRKMPTSVRPGARLTVRPTYGIPVSGASGCYLRFLPPSPCRCESSNILTMGDTLDELETPVPVVDLDRLERNLARTAAYAKQHKLALRPHVKTHKAPFVAERQVQSGARGLTCATP